MLSSWLQKMTPMMQTLNLVMVKQVAALPTRLVPSSLISYIGCVS